MKILLIEDNPHDALFTSKILETYNMQLAHAPTFSQGVELFKTQSFDVILCDLDLPDNDKNIEPLKEFYEYLPVIVLTMNDDYQLAVRAISDGAQDYLIKNNYTDDLLRRSVQYAVERFSRQKLALENERLRQQIISKLDSLSSSFSRVKEQLRLDQN